MGSFADPDSSPSETAGNHLRSRGETSGLHIRAARRAAAAPELERYLDPANVDLMVTDQVQAVRVRVERGLEVFERRVRDALVIVRRRLAIDLVVLSIYAVAMYFAARDGVFFTSWVLTVAALWVVWTATRAALDWRRLRRAAARFSRSDLDRLETSKAILDHGEAVLEEARALGMIPRPGDQGAMAGR